MGLDAGRDYLNQLSATQDDSSLQKVAGAVA